MKKTIITVLAVAILGAIKLYTNGHATQAAQLVAAPTSSAGASDNSSDNSSSTPAQATTAQAASYKDGTYTGDSENTPYGTVQIAVVISGGKITDVKFLQMPNDLGNSQVVTSFSEPLLKQTTLQKQSAKIDFVSGATSTSDGYQASLQAALDQAVQS